MQSNFNPFEVQIEDPPQDAFLKTQFIRGLPFPHKLWVIINAANYNFMRWNRDGTAILLDLDGLEDYLNSPRSIFNMKSRAEFLKHLEEFQYERLDAAPEAGNDLILQYKNEDFQRDRIDLLGKVRRRTDEASGETSEKDKFREVDAGEAAANLLSSKKAERGEGDPCFMKFGTLSSAEKSRMQLETTLQFENAKRKLQEQLKSHNQNTAGQNQQRRGVARTLANAELFVDLPSSMFENPLDSVFQRSEGSRPDYAGYYGNCSEEQLKKFFGDYLPQKEEGPRAHNSGIPFKQEETPQQLLFSGDGDYTPTLPPLMLSPLQQASRNVNLNKKAVEKFFGDYLPQKEKGLSVENSGMRFTQEELEKSFGEKFPVYQEASTERKEKELSANNSCKRFKQEEKSQKFPFSGDSDYIPTLPPLMLSPLQQTPRNVNLNKETVKKFFGDYLPQKEKGPSAHNSGKHVKEEETQPLIFSGESDYTPTAPPLMLSPLQQTTPNLNLPCELQPIFKSDDEDGTDLDYANKVHSDTQASGGDFTMNEFTGLMPFDENDNDPGHVNTDLSMMQQDPGPENESLTSFLDELNVFFEKEEGPRAQNSGLHVKKEEAPQQLIFSGESDYIPTTPPLMLSPLQQTTPNLNLPWELEPIFRSDDEDGTDLDYANKIHSDTQASGGDVTMNEFTGLMSFDENDNDPGHVNADLSMMQQDPGPENESLTLFLDGLDELFESDQE